MSDQDIHEQDLLLGKETHYVFQYDASLIFPIPRKQNRAKLNLPENNVNGNLPFFGFDVWTGYEVSWLNPIINLVHDYLDLTSVTNPLATL